MQDRFLEINDSRIDILIGTNYDPQWTSTKIIFIVIFFTGLVVYTAYSASLTSALAVIKIKYPFKDLRTFYDQTNYKIGSVRNTAMDELFQVYTFQFSILRYVILI